MARPPVDQTCQFCGTTFQANAAEVARGGGKYCSRPCAYKSRSNARFGTVEEFFWMNVKIGTGCWEWTGSRLPTERPYGFFRYAGTMHSAHRFSFELHHSPIPEGIYVCHVCDNPPCVRPDHLFLGTNSENIIDAVKKGRHALAKLNPDAVRQIREWAAEGVTGKEAARRLGLCKATTCRVIRGDSWSHVNSQPEDSESSANTPNH